MVGIAITLTTNYLFNTIQDIHDWIKGQLFHNLAAKLLYSSNIQGKIYKQLYLSMYHGKEPRTHKSDAIYKRLDKTNTGTRAWWQSKMVGREFVHHPPPWHSSHTWIFMMIGERAIYTASCKLNLYKKLYRGWTNSSGWCNWAGTIHKTSSSCSRSTRIYTTM